VIVKLARGMRERSLVPFNQGLCDTLGPLAKIIFIHIEKETGLKI